MHDELVRLAYQLMLGRDPEVGETLQSSSVWDLRDQILGSSEFANQLAYWRFAEILYRDDAAARKRTTALAEFLRVGPDTEEQIASLVAEPEAPYAKTHAKRFADQLRAVVAMVRQLGNDAPRVLDIGIAAVAGMYRRLLPGIQLYSSHFDDGNQMQKKMFTEKFGVIDHYRAIMDRESIAERYPAIVPFDVVIFSEVAEHLRMSPPEMMRDLLRLIAPNGFIYLTTPNGLDHKAAEALFSGKKNDVIYRRSEAWLHDNGHSHVRVYTAREVRDAVRSAGGKVIHEGIMEYRHDPRRHWITNRFVSARGQLVFLIGHGN